MYNEISAPLTLNLNLMGISENDTITIEARPQLKFPAGYEGIDSTTISIYSDTLEVQGTGFTDYYELEERVESLFSRDEIKVSGNATLNGESSLKPGKSFWGDVGIELRVTPRINDESRITLLVDASVEALLSAAEVLTDKPRSTKRTVRTQVTVSDGDTVIIGGLIAENVIENKKYIPVLSGLPFIGRMFQSTSVDKEQRELLIFITPNVVG